jgi:cell division GTPase FtsZ
MTTKSIRKSDEVKELIDDVSQEVAKPKDDLDTDKLAALKAKMSAKKQASEQITTEEDTMQEKEDKQCSIRFGFIGSGQAGSRLAEAFHKRGYNAVAINTASQDLQHIDVPEQNKLLLQFGLGGAGKDLTIGKDAAEQYKEQIEDLVQRKLADSQLLIFCTSLGGGSGAGSAEVIVDLLAQMERPVAVITVLPMSTDDPQTKSNAIVTLSKFTKMAQTRKIDNLIVVDNARIENIYNEVGPLNFFNVSNEAIVDPIDKFNCLSSMASSVKGLDPTEFGKLFTDGQGLSIYGMMKVPNFTDETAIAEAVMENLDGSLLASGFDLKKARYVGVIFVANKKVWDQIPHSSINYAMAMVNETCQSPLGVFRGIYVDDSMEEYVVRVYSMFSGLDLPHDRINQLKAEAKEKMAQVEQKNEARAQGLKLEAEEETVSAAQAIKKRIENKKSAFGKLHNAAVIDRRKG